MTYHFLEPKKPTRRAKKWWILLPILGLLGGVYVIANTLAPAWQPLLEPSDTVAKQLIETPKPAEENRLYIPKINVDVEIVTGDASALEKGAWWRHPENGNPSQGGNFVLSAHRFNLGLTPQQTRAKSPFYRIDKIEPDDEIVIDFEGERFVYKVTQRFLVNRDATEIEQRSSEAKLTLYSCDLRGEKAGREVIEATLEKNVAPING